jgi:hypothetical protein
MMTRLFSAVCSCSFTVSLWRMLRSCSRLMVAYVGRSLAHTYVRGSQGTRDGAEQVQRADDLVAQPHRQGLHGGEPGLLGGGGEPGPALRFGGQVGGGDGPASAEAVQAGTLVVLQLK